MLSRTFWTQILFLVVVSFLLAPSAQAEIRTATVAVDGMACPFCAFGIEKRLKKVAGVGSVTISARKGTATLVAKAEKSIDVEQIPGAIKAAGFTPGSITVDAVGKVSTDERDRVVLKVSGADQTYLLASFDAQTEEELRAFAEKGALVSVRGAIHHHQEDLTAISPETVEEISK